MNRIIDLVHLAPEPLIIKHWKSIIQKMMN